MTEPTQSMVVEAGSSAKDIKSDLSDTFAAASSARPSGAPAAGGSGTGSRASCCSCLRRRGADSKCFRQTFVILRHSERKDYVDPTYKDSEEGLKWPHDAPLTEEGIKLAKEVSEELAKEHQKAQFASIVCSPYRRCMETASEVAKRLHLPVLIDQEIGEVRDRSMPEDHISHRSPQELSTMAKDLKMKLMNPTTEDGGIKLFGKTPTWPENLEDAKDRYVVRMETYIRMSAEEKQNMIVVTHADAVVAALVMFERGGVDVTKMGFCARVIACRDVKDRGTEHGVFAEQWAVDATRLGAEVFKEEDQRKVKIYEKQYLETCDETQAKVVKRKEKRTKTDFMFDSALKDANRKAMEEEEEEEDSDEDPPPQQPSTAASGS